MTPAGSMVNPQLRNYRIPAFADVPRTEVFFADTYDTIGPLGAKAQGECAINPVAPAISNALMDATGVRFATPAVHARPHLRQARARIHERRARRAASSRRGSVTIVTQTRVRPEDEEAFARWQDGTSRGDRGLSGFIQQTVMPPSPPAQVDWVILQRFADDSKARSPGSTPKDGAAAGRRGSRCWSAATMFTWSMTAERACCRRRSRW